jgi:hypothetical protein
VFTSAPHHTELSGFHAASVGYQWVGPAHSDITPTSRRHHQGSKDMKSRYDFVQDTKSRRAVAIVRAGAGATVVAALFGLSLLTAHQVPGASVADAFGPESTSSEPVMAMAAPPADASHMAEDTAQPPRYMGEPAVY